MVSHAVEAQPDPSGAHVHLHTLPQEQRIGTVNETSLASHACQQVQSMKMKIVFSINVAYYQGHHIPNTSQLASGPSPILGVRLDKGSPQPATISIPKGPGGR